MPRRFEKWLSDPANGSNYRFTRWATGPCSRGCYLSLGGRARRLWLAKCCKIQQLAYLYSTTFIYVQQDIFVFNVLYLYSTMRIFLQLQLKLFSFNNNICSTSTTIFVQLQLKLFSFNNNICSTSTVIFI